MRGGPAAGEQYGERFCGKGESQVEHGGQDLSGESRAGWAATLSITIRGQDLGEAVELLVGHPGQCGVGQQGLGPGPVPLSAGSERLGSWGMAVGVQSKFQQSHNFWSRR